MTPTNDIVPIPTPAKSSAADRWMWCGFLLGLMLLAYLFGMITAIRQTPPFRTVRDAWLGLAAWQEQQGLLAQKWPAYLWTPTERTERGLANSDPWKAAAGYTLYTSTHDGGAALVNMAGDEIHRWDAAFRKVWPHAQHVPSWVPDHFVHIRKAHVYPNGDLLAVYSTTANTPSGCGLAKLDRNSETIWTFDANAHHDFDVDDNGDVYVLTHRVRQLGPEDEVLARLSNIPVIEDLVTILSSDGEEKNTFSVLDALVDSPFFRPLLCHVDRYGDITHNNTIDVVRPGFAAHHAAVSAGDVMVCLRNLGLMVIINPESESIVWGTTGPWNHPHDPDPLPNGNLLIFDNFMVRGARHGSAVVEFNPRANQIAWSYSGEPDAPLRSDIRSQQQLLKSGNVLITESDQGRIVEVTREGEVVWEFLNPVRGGESENLIPVICGAHRYAAEDLTFVKELAGEDGKITARPKSSTN